MAWVEYGLQISLKPVRTALLQYKLWLRWPFNQSINRGNINVLFIYLLMSYNFYPLIIAINHSQ